MKTKALFLCTILSSFSATAWAAYPSHQFPVVSGAKALTTQYGECVTSLSNKVNLDSMKDCGMVKDEPNYVPSQISESPAPKPKVVTETISLAGKTLFTFDNSELKTEAVELLETVVSKVKGAKLISLTVEGHTDYMGNAEYNKTLSEKRAKVVADYLSSKLGQNISHVGHGSTFAAMTDTCKAEIAKLGKKVNAKQKRSKLIECLAPDRRVDIEVQAEETITLPPSTSVYDDEEVLKTKRYYPD